MKMNWKLCVNCRHCEQDAEPRLPYRNVAKCFRNGALGPVGDGLEGGDCGVQPCWKERSEAFPWACGPEAKFFEQK